MDALIGLLRDNPPLLLVTVIAIGYPLGRVTIRGAASAWPQSSSRGSPSARSRPI